MPDTPSLPPRDVGAVDLGKPVAREFIPRDDMPSDAHPVSMPTHGEDGRVTNIFADGGDLNDIAHLREQDQTVAQLGTQLDMALGSPWVEVDASEMYSADVASKSAPVRKVVMQVGCMSVHPASVATHHSIVGHGSVSTVDMGDRKVTVPPEGKKKLSIALNAAYDTIVGPRQALLIRQLNEYAMGGNAEASLPSSDFTLALRAGKTYVICADSNDLKETKARLDDAYRKVTKDYIDLIMAELAQATKPGVGTRFKPDNNAR